MTSDSSSSTHNAQWQGIALTFVGLCTIQQWNVPVPHLIHLLAEVLLNKTDPDLSPTCQIWETVYLSNESAADQLPLAWWACPDGGKDCCTFDELEEAFERFLPAVCQRISACKSGYITGN